jgi:hypothetical protein
MINYKKPYENIRKKKKLIVTGSKQQRGAQIVGSQIWLDHHIHQLANS